ncbi:MAG: Asp-tRNA(Asn)/Glu-tRNA(Gln) amidotransferase subunit GatB [Clostridia bacterium]|nr:Asp-tRNA(Asn)/Glu-tRNA(Gln) amidotransferase subunit GatB [Clostridia bacterium]
MKEYDVVIGLEIHAELKTKTKVFCSCKNEFGSKPNENTCPVCTGMPGALPIINKKAVELCIKAGLCFGCKISNYAVMERKNYFYPDLSKAYQISQLVHPLCIGGQIELASGKVMRLNRIHLEEDAGKLTHISKSVGTLVDYNRGGTPLIEIVTEPDFSSAEEVDEFLKRIREALVFADIANCKMEEGGMRCDVNLSLKEKGSTILGTRTEMKNLNSFKSVSRAIEYEIKRQTEVLNAGEKVIQETRKWDDAKGKNLTMRSKEEAQDYRYFPDPDILPIAISEEDIAKIASEMPQLPQARRQKYVEEFGLPKYDAEILTTSKYISDYFEECTKLLNSPKKISNWIMVDLLKLVKEQEEFVFPISAQHLVEIIKMVEEKTINKTVGIQLLEKVIETRQPPKSLADKMGLLVTISNEQILELLQKLKAENTKVCEDYKAAPEKVVGFIVGYVMKNTGGKANSMLVKQLIPEVFG